MEGGLIQTCVFPSFLIFIRIHKTHSPSWLILLESIAVCLTKHRKYFVPDILMNGQLTLISKNSIKRKQSLFRNVYRKFRPHLCH